MITLEREKLKLKLVKEAINGRDFEL